MSRSPTRRQPSGIAIRLNPFARKGSGSYYTPDELVALIIERTVGPLVDEQIAAFEDALTDPKATLEDARAQGRRGGDPRR